jgi:hypothetical protein
MKQLLLFASIFVLVLSSVAFASDEEKAKEIMAADAIDWNKLSTCLPGEVKGMEVGDVDGGSMSMADPTNPGKTFSYSYAERTYTAGKKEIILRITDTFYSTMLTMGYMMAIEMDTPDGSVKTVKVGDQTAKRMQNKEKGKVTSSQYLILVSERVLVMAESDAEATTDEIEALLVLIDFEKLNGMITK